MFYTNENNMNNTFETKDKYIAPFLFTQPDITFIGNRTVEHRVIFQFIPLDRCMYLTNLFMTKKAPLVQPKDLLEAVETYKDIVFEMKDKDEKYERK